MSGTAYKNIRLKSIDKQEEITMSKYAGTQTEKNLEAAFAGESQGKEGGL